MSQVHEAEKQDSKIFSSTPLTQEPPASPSSTPPTQPQKPQKESQKQEPNPAQQRLPKETSPVQVFLDKWCSSCSDYGTCTPKTKAGQERMHLCLKIVHTEILRVIADNTMTISKMLLQQKVDQATQQPKQPQQETVQRSTRPVEGHKDQGSDITWINALSQAGDVYEKALEKDNQRSDGYAILESELIQAGNEGKKGLPVGDKWLWLSSDASYIGRKIQRFKK